MDANWLYAGGAMVVSYLCGSIPTSVWWGKGFFGIDVREHGSHNAGATNTFRVLGPKAGIPVLVIDILKGFLPARILSELSAMGTHTEDWYWLRVALVLAAVVGHLYPVFANFRGGKGVATSLGGLLAVHPGSALICVVVFIVVFVWSRFVSLASLCAALAFPIDLIVVYHERSGVLLGFAITLCIIVFWTHRHNIGRLIKRTENRMTFTGRAA